MKGKSCLNNLTSYSKVTHLVNEGKEVDVIFLDFGKDFKYCPSQTPTMRSAGSYYTGWWTGWMAELRGL